MRVRIRLQAGRPIQRKSGKNRHLALAGGSLLIPLALMAYALGFWSLASDMGFAGAFGIGGLFSHWQIWIAAAALLHIAASVLNRYGRRGDFHAPVLLTLRLLPLRRPDGDSSRSAPSKGEGTRVEIQMHDNRPKG